ncbi:MAG: NTP transferase domain-containing protein [Treponema sp.]|jgi:spore coat polysaccharide biosynthesis protein SpsF|nr:NTP transferase domain-containing protein [Treponema sp.]
MTALILQGRLDSTRLPRKSLLPLEGEPLIYRVMEALAFVPAGRRILACPEDCEAAFRPLAERAGFEVVTGPKEDVLARYCRAVRLTGAVRVIRATADNPYVFADAAAALAEEAAALDADYAGYAGLPLGAGVEAVKAEALLRAEREASLRSEREHVCPYLYHHPEKFRLHRPLAPLIWQAPHGKPERQDGVNPFRLTVDTEADYRRARELYRGLHAGSCSEPYRGETILLRAAELPLTVNPAEAPR